METVKILETEKSYTVVSKPFSRITNNARYTYHIELSDTSDNRVIDNLEQDIRFSMPPAIQKAFGLDKFIQ